MRKAKLICLIAGFACGSIVLGGCTNNDDEWVTLFNGENLDGWTPKFNGHPLGENYLDTFQVQDGKLVVSYDKYETFKEKFGHLFYKTPYSHYTLKAEYRFIGEQVPDAPDWALRNNGFMLHAQSPESMALIQEFPASMEVQLLGGLGDGTRHTGNVCTIGTSIVLEGKLDTRHCISSNSTTYHGDQWVELEVEMHGSEKVIHKINGEVVFEYEKPQFDPAESQHLIDQTGNLFVDSGYIAIQAESHPTEFRNIRIKPLPGNSN